MKKTLKILFYFITVILIVTMSIPRLSSQRDGVVTQIKVKEENQTKENNETKKVKEIEIKINEKPMEAAKSEENITTTKVGYWELVKIEFFNQSVKYKFFKDKKIIKTMIDSNQDGKIDTIYCYDEKGRKIMSSLDYTHDGIIDKNTSKQFTDDGKLKELNIIYFYGGIYDFENRKKIYNDKGNILKETVEKSIYKKYYEIEYHYSDIDQLLEVVIVSKDKRFVSTKYEYEDEKLVSQRDFQEGEAGSGKDYIYEDGVLKEVRDFGGFWDDSTFYNDEGLVIEKIANYGKSTKYLYDDENRLISEKSDAIENYIFYNEDGKKIKTEHYEKNSDGEFEQVSYTLFDEDKTQKISLNSDKVEITYNKKLHLEKEVIGKRREVHDEHGNLVEVWDDAQNKLIERRFYRFVVGDN